jgi:hypothetical protein
MFLRRSFLRLSRRLGFGRFGWLDMDVVESKEERTLQFQVPRHSVALTAISMDPDRFHIAAIHLRVNSRPKTHALTIKQMP